MIRVFAPTDRDYTSNGDVVLPAFKARVHNAENGDYYLELQCSIEYSDYIVGGNLIVAPTPQGAQAFRIKTVRKSKKRLEVKAWHVYYDTANYLIHSCITPIMPYYALERLKNASDQTAPFTFSSDMEGTSTQEFSNVTLLEALTTCLEEWGGYLVRDNFNIAINASIGVDNGITIAYGKNLKELTAEYDFSNVCTKVLPIGKDDTVLDNLYVVSTTQYDIPYSKIVTFEQNIEESSYPDHASYIDALQEDLQEKAEAYLAENALPTVNYTLSGTPEKVTDIGDIIEVQDERIGVDILTSVIAYEYDAIQEKYVSLEFGNFGKTLKQLIKEVAQS